MLISRRFVSASILFVAAVSASAQTLAPSTSAPSLSTTLNAPLPSAASTEKTPTKLELKASFYAKSFEDKLVNSKYAGGTFDIIGARQFFETMSMRMDLTFLYTTGVYSNQYLDEGSAPNTLLLNEIVVQYDPFKMLTLEGGVIPMTFTSHPTVFEANGFPSLRETFKIEGDHAKASAFALQSIPTAGSKAVKPAEKGITTTFNAVGATLQNNPKGHSALTIGASGMGFEFSNLNSSAAADSQYLGNTIAAPGPQPRFVYGYAGWETAGSLGYKLTSRSSVKLTGALLKNERAPDKKNRAYTYGASATVPVSPVTTMTLQGNFFYTESDTLPASYASFARNYNNRFGQTAKISFKNEKEKISGFVQYIRSNEIVDRPFTADRDTVSVGLEAAYDIL